MKYMLMLTLSINLVFLAFAAGSFAQGQKSNALRSSGDKVQGQQSKPQVFATDLKSLTRKLRTVGSTVKLDEKVSQPFFSTPGRILIVNGEPVQVFEFKTAAKAATEVRKVSKEGSPIGTTMITWVAPPHFFRNGKLVVLYLGENSTVIKALEKVLGGQFAGK